MEQSTTSGQPKELELYPLFSLGSHQRRRLCNIFPQLSGSEPPYGITGTCFPSPTQQLQDMLLKRGLVRGIEPETSVPKALTSRGCVSFSSLLRTFQTRAPGWSVASIREDLSLTFTIKTHPSHELQNSENNLINLMHELVSQQWRHHHPGLYTQIRFIHHSVVFSWNSINLPLGSNWTSSPHGWNLTNQHTFMNKDLGRTVRYPKIKHSSTDCCD